MSRRLRAMWSASAPLGALSIAVLGLGACGSSSKPATSTPVVGDRRELPSVHVEPADSGPPPAPVATAPRVPPPDFPRTVALGALAESERIADLAVLAEADRFLLAWVTYFADAGGGIARPSLRGAGKKRAAASPGPQQKQGATVVVRALDAEGEALGSANVISVKADSMGGVSLAIGGSPQGDAGLAWVGKDAGISQVFVTRVSRSGEKQAQRMITRSKEGCSDVALVKYKDGFVVAYVDSRDGVAGIYAAKLGKDLERIGEPRLVAQAKGEASDVRMLARADDLVLAWTEARQNAEIYGVFAVRMLASDLSLRSDPVRVALGPPHARGVDLSPFGEGVALAWVEESAGAPSNGASRVAVLARLDATMRSLAEPMHVTLPAQASSLALDCDRVCRVVVAGSEGDDLAFYGFAYDGAHVAPAARLASIPGVSTEDTNPVVARDWLFFAEDNLQGSGRIRKAKLAWR